MLHIYPTPAAMAEACASAIAERAISSVESRGIFNLALAGGSTPRGVYEHLAKLALDWSKVHLFWSDERCVPPNNEASNYKMAKQSLIDQIVIPDANIHRMRGELDPAEAAVAYRAELNAHFGESGVPRFDLVLLGLGEDGHTASLFPGTEAVKRGDELVVENYVPLNDAWRLTFTFTLINNAREVFFLVTGEAKAAVAKGIIEVSNSRLPASAVRPISGELHWYLDQAAAGTLAPK
jgi:6-phosphogluconolactonase